MRFQVVKAVYLQYFKKQFVTELNRNIQTILRRILNFLALWVSWLSPGKADKESWEKYFMRKIFQELMMRKISQELIKLELSGSVVLLLSYQNLKVSMLPFLRTIFICPFYNLDVRSVLWFYATSPLNIFWKFNFKPLTFP